MKKTSMNEEIKNKMVATYRVKFSVRTIVTD